MAIALVVAASCTNSGTNTTIGGDTVLEPNGIIVKVVDGDTIDVESDGQVERIRMIGFDTPESVDPRRPVECFGKEASKHLADLSPVGTPVYLELDTEARDKYDRLLAYVYRAEDGLFLNLQMVADGYAHTLSIPPNITFAANFREAESAARRANIGLWSACDDS